jgi:hypothetical protein
VKGTENISRPVNQYQSAFFAHIALQFKKLAKKLATILAAFIATNGISITSAPVSTLLFGRNTCLAKQLFSQNRYSAAATNAQEQ